MNKHLHRIIFNAKRGQRMAVAESASASGSGGNGKGVTTASGQTGSPLKGSVAATALTAALAACAFAAIALFTSASAQVVADPSALANQRPTVLTAHNVVPLQNISTLRQRARRLTN